MDEPTSLQRDLLLAGHRNLPDKRSSDRGAGSDLQGSCISQVPIENQYNLGIYQPLIPPRCLQQYFAVSDIVKM